jgi:long-chain acyl-CoA synthetase
VIEGQGTLTFADLDEGSAALARLLRSRGLRAGDGVAICMENNLAFLEALWGSHRAGLYYTAISCLLTEPELAYIVDDCGARAFITSSSMGELARALRSAAPRSVRTWLMAGGALDGYEAYEQAVKDTPPEPFDATSQGRHMLYSSGTTGRPKGVKSPLPAPGTPDSATTLAQHLWGFDHDSTLLSPAPLYHAAPLRFTMAMHRVGGTVVLMDDFDALEFLRLIERHRATHVLAVPTMFVRLLKLSEEARARFDLSSLRCCVHGAAPCPPAVKRRMMDWWGPILHEYYAGTEENGFVACNSDEWLSHPGTVGRPLMSTVHVVDEDGNELPPGRTGTVYFESATQFRYHNDPEKTRSSYDHRGWSTLGDVGHVDEDGYLYLTDRRAYLIVSGGVNIYPQEVEDLLVTHPKVLDAAVFGVPHEEFGEEVKAVVQTVDAAVAGPGLEAELIAFCKESLASYKCPRSIDFEQELPRLSNGKLIKRLLKELYWQGHETRIV